MKGKIFLVLLILSSFCYSAKLQVSLSIESLCLGCGNILSESFGPSLGKGLLDMVDVTFLPFGNTIETKYGSTYIYKCLNGSDK